MNVQEEDLVVLFNYFSSHTGLPGSQRGSDTTQLIQDRCNALFSRDYDIELVDNVWCSSYPPQIVLLGNLDYQKGKDRETNKMKRAEILRKGMEASKLCRCRQRFPVPVIRVGDRNICRSAGLSEKMELAVKTNFAHWSSSVSKAKVAQRGFQRKKDVEWLGVLKVKHVVDLMLENTRKLLGIVRLCSSEKVTAGYEEFTVAAMPYPGVETFSHFERAIQACNDKLPVTVWATKAEAALQIDRTFKLKNGDDWRDYTIWDINRLTVNYMRYIVENLLQDEDTEAGILIHCISGWDRTPTFVALLRILLWAEGRAHENLTPIQILYLTVAYDWVLFGHNLVRRMKSQQQIFYFCFYILKQMFADIEFDFKDKADADDVQNATDASTWRTAAIADWNGPDAPDNTKDEDKMNGWSVMLSEPIATAEKSRAEGKKEQSDQDQPSLIPQGDKEDEDGIIEASTPEQPSCDAHNERKRKILAVWTIFEKVYNRTIRLRFRRTK